MRKNGVEALAALVFLAVLIGNLPARAESFTAAQRAEIGVVIREYLLANPQLLREVSHELERRDFEERQERAAAAITERAGEVFRAKGDPTVGNPQGSVTLVEFMDYNCGYCRRSFASLRRLIETDDDLRIVIKEFPLLGEGSEFAARAALASRRQGLYWAFHGALMDAQGRVDESTVLRIARAVGLDAERLEKDMAAPEVDEIIARNKRLARAIGVNGTPAFIIGDQLIPGAVGFAALQQMIAALRQDGGCGIC